MYNWEIEELLKKRNYYIGGDELLKIISINENPQITHINCYYGEWFDKKNQAIYYIEAQDDFDKEKKKEFIFCAMPYDEAKEKGLVKSKKLD